MTTAVTRIESASNATYRRLVSLLKSRGIRKERAAIIPGRRVIEEYVSSFPDRCLAMICTDPIECHGLAMDIPRIVLKSRLFENLDRWNCGPPLLKVAAEPPALWDQTNWPHGCTAVLPFQDPRNIGAAIRSAAAFGVPRVILTEEAAHPYHPDGVRAAAGVLPYIRMYRLGPLADGAKLPRPLLVIDKGGEDLRRILWPQAFGLLVGLEGSGVPQTLGSVRTVGIPMRREVESLNAAVALSIVLHEWSVKTSSTHGVVS